MIDANIQEHVAINRRSEALFQEDRLSMFQRTDRLFAVLLGCEWLTSIAVALIISPRTWVGEQSSIHIHVLAAIFLGGAITVFPIYLSWLRPGEAVTRHIIAVSQMLFSALFIHLTGGRIETHFHIFGSLAFLGAYGDWRVLITASVMVIMDHVLRGIFWPQSVYGVLTIEPWRWLEHTWWVVFEDLFLIKKCLNNVAQTHKVAHRQAEVEDTRERVEELVEERTKELHISERRLSTQYAVNRVLAKSNSLAEAAPEILRAMTTSMLQDINGNDGTIHGEVWLPDNNGLLSCIYNIQTSHGCFVEPFHSRDFIKFAPGIGLPGRVFSTQAVAQITNIENDNNFPRREIALESGLKSAFAFPVIAENEVKAVVGFITDSQRALTNDELFMLESLGQQIGQFIVRKRTESDNIQLANIVQSSNDAIIGQDLDGMITSWNRGAERMFGYSEEEAKGKGMNILVPEDKLMELEELDLLGKLIENFETVRLGKHRQRKDVSIASSPIMDSDRKVVGMSVIARDISERKEAERKVSEFYSTVSHELRTPLTSIRGALGLIEGGVIKPDTDAAMELIHVARTSSDRLVRLINDILDLKKIEAGKFEMTIESSKPQDLIKDVLLALTGMAEEAGIKLAYDTKTNDSFPCDRDRCTQVITNLVSNAIKFSPPGSCVIVSTETGAMNSVRFLISDTGPGIASEHLHKLFDKFQQVDASDTRAKGGTGLGLSICKAIVEEHGGKIGVSSTWGEGSTFWFELPGSQTNPSLTALTAA